MASIGGYDLNNFLDVSDEAKNAINEAPTQEEKDQILADAQRLQWRNKTLSDTYEPGSTFKIITLSMALEEGKVSLDDSFFCGGSVQVQGRTNPVRCWKTSGHGSQSLTQAVQHSCNAAFVNIGMRVGAQAFYKYCDAFGFLELAGDSSQQLTAKTGIDLGGESGSIWWSEDTFYSEKNKSQLAAASFGQTFTITPLQLITAVSACVNGGYLMQPYVVESLLDEDGLTVYNHKPKVVRRVISEETSKTVCSILEQVVGDGLRAKGLKLAVAESCTGGLLSKRITDIPGCSDYYLGGVCSYANEVKMNVLGVRKETLDTVGAVSAETAEQMAAGVAKALGADIGVGITGIAGPGGGTEDKPTGLVYISVWYDGKFFTRKTNSSFGRDRVRMQAASTALDLIRRHIL